MQKSEVCVIRSLRRLALIHGLRLAIIHWSTEWWQLTRQRSTRNSFDVSWTDGSTLQWETWRRKEKELGHWITKIGNHFVVKPSKCELVHLPVSEVLRERKISVKSGEKMVCSTNRESRPRRLAGQSVTLSAQRTVSLRPDSHRHYDDHYWERIGSSASLFLWGGRGEIMMSLDRKEPRAHIWIVSVLFGDLIS